MTIKLGACSMGFVRLFRPMVMLGTAAVLLAVAGCTTLGPTGPYIDPNTVIDLDKVDVNQLNADRADANIGRDGAPLEQLRPGDKIQVRIFDTGDQVSTADAKVLDLGVFQIDKSGYVNLPYAGRLHVSNMTVSRLQNVIARKMKGSSVSPQATVTIVGKPATTFTSFGGFKSPGEFKFEPGELTMAQAVARSGGLLDDRARREKVYLFRHEPAQYASSLGIIKAEDVQPGLMTPVVYQVDMSQTQSFFLMQQVKMKKGDMLYVPDAGNGGMTNVFQKPPPSLPPPPAPSLPN